MEKLKKNQALIKEILNETDGHMTAEEIYNEAKARGKRISLATVYNNLGELCESKKIRKIPSSCEGKDRYDKAYIPHGHLICERCRKIKDFFNDGIGKAIYESTGIKAESYDLNVYYVCNDCRKIEEKIEKNKGEKKWN